MKKEKNMEQSRRHVSHSMDFFKVYLSDISSCRLTLPKSFTMLINGTIPEDCTLKDHRGMTWLVVVKKVEDDLVVKDGWRAFVEHHSLADADFLIFKFDGKSHFDVDIYARNGLKIRNSNANDNASGSHVTKEMKSVEKEAETEQETEPKPKRCRKPKNFVHNKSSKTEPYGVPKGPHWFKKIDRDSRIMLYVPRSDVRQYKIKLGNMINLEDEKGKLWPASVTYRNDGRIHITNGWSDFRKEHKLQLGCWCLCEFLLQGHNVCSKIRVRAIRRPDD